MLNRFTRSSAILKQAGFYSIRPARLKRIESRRSYAAEKPATMLDPTVHAKDLVLPILQESVDIDDDFYLPIRVTDPRILRAVVGTTKYSVTDLATHYCELRTFYDTITVEPRQDRESMTRGTEIHLSLEKSVNIEEMVKLDPSVLLTREDEWARKLYTAKTRLDQLNDLGKVREVYVIGLVNDRVVSGYIDLLDVTQDGEIKIIDTKSRASKTLPLESQQRSAFHQVQLYRYLLNAMITEGRGYLNTFEEIARRLHLQMDVPLSQELVELMYPPPEESSGLFSEELSDYTDGSGEKALRDVVRDLAETLHQLRRPVSDRMEVEYVGRRGRGREKEIYTIGSIEFAYDEESVHQLADYSLAFWEGKRNPMGVPVDEYYKCMHCSMAPRCRWKASISQSQ
ncbi:hypothetical protein TRVA0_002S04566 [Trichomonascus vanleenenianus]|uniref:uncharacterized protein n=1 Tax=Trichomonascus vanleenenianus TaxID=2268995 RepID=UPI003ECA3E4C